MANITFPAFTEISNTCVSWCRDAYIIQQNNLEVKELGIIALAVASLFVNHFILNHSEWILNNSEIKEKQLEKIYTGTSYFAFFLMIAFLVYAVVFR